MSGGSYDYIYRGMQEAMEIPSPFFCHQCGDLIHNEIPARSHENSYHIECLIRKISKEVVEDIINKRAC